MSSIPVPIPADVLQNCENDAKAANIKDRQSKTRSPQYVGLPDLPVGNWTKLTRGFPVEFSEEKICEHGERHGAQKHLTAGYRMFKSDKVKDVLLSYMPLHCFCKAKVEASFSVSHTYTVNAKFNKNGNVEAGFCTCKAGASGVCKHVVAVLWFLFDVLRQGHRYIPEPLACTEKSRSWGTGSKRPNTSQTKFHDLHFVKHKVPKRGENRQPVATNMSMGNSSDRHNIKLTTNLLTNFSHVLTNFSVLPMLRDVFADHQYEPTPSTVSEESPNVLREEQPTCDLQLPKPPNLPLQILWNTTSDKQHNLNISLSLEEAQELEKKTREQSKTNLWHEERRKRITASKFGAIVNRQAEVTQEFVKSIFNPSSFQTKYTLAGIQNEEAALKKYRQQKVMDVFPSGLCINPGVPFLGATPDGLVFDHSIKEFGLVEVKTLAKAKEMGLSIDEAISEKKAPFLLAKTKQLSKNHHYFFQIQGQMAITGFEWCDLVVDSGKDLYIERVLFDKQLWVGKMLPKLASFYDIHYPS